jgi:hypothetical protein
VCSCPSTDTTAEADLPRLLGYHASVHFTRMSPAGRDAGTTGLAHMEDSARAALGGQWCVPGIPRSNSPAHTALNELTRRAQPLLDQRSALRGEHNRLHDHLTHTLPLARRLNRTDQTLTETRHLVAALDTWHNWAAGEAVPPAHLVKTARILNDLDDPHAALAKPLANWLDRHHIAPTQATRPQHDFHPMEQRFEPPGLDIGL